MQSLTFGRALQKIVRGLRVRDLLELLDPLFDVNKPENLAIKPSAKQKMQDLVFEIELGLVTLRTDPTTARLLDGLGLRAFLDRPARAHLLTMFQAAGSRNDVTGDRFLWFAYHELAALRGLEKSFTTLVMDSKTKPQGADVDVIELSIDDYDGESLTVERFEKILASLRALYEAVAEYQGVEERRSLISYIDSGTEFTVGLQGVADVIHAIRDVFRDAWRGLRFRKNERVERDLETVRDELQLVGEIRKRVENGELDNETGSRLEHAINLQMVHLLGTGVLPAEVETAEEYDRHEVLGTVRERPLLGPGARPNAEDGEAPE